MGEAAAQAQLAELAWRTGASGCGCGTPTTPRPSGRPWWSGRPSRPGRWRPPSRRRAPSRPTAWAGCRSTGSSMCRGRWSCVRWPGTRGEPLAPIKLVEGPADEGLLARWAVAGHPPRPARPRRRWRRQRPWRTWWRPGRRGWPGRRRHPALPGALVAPRRPSWGLPDATNAAAVAPHDAQAAATILRMDPDGPGYRRATEVLEAEPTDGRAALRLAEALAGSEAKDDAAGRLCTLARDALADGTGSLGGPGRAPGVRPGRDGGVPRQPRVLLDDSGRRRRACAGAGRPGRRACGCCRASRGSVWWIMWMATP
ncbi:MAG: hypothetical protein R3F43_10575 [bacterium]